MVLLLLKILLWIYTKRLFVKIPDNYEVFLYEKGYYLYEVKDYLYMPDLVTMREKLESVEIYFRDLRYWDSECMMYWEVNKKLLDTVKLLEKLYNLRYITFKSTRLTDVEIEEWNLVFEEFWFYKFLCMGGAGRKAFHYPTPVNSDKLESAILHMTNNFLFDHYIYYLTYKGYYTRRTIREVQKCRVDDFYDPLKNINFVHLNKVH